MKTPDYDQCYKVLGLEPGAPLELIEDEWKLLAAAYHPDKFTGRLQDKALRRLQEINNARDQLKQYWTANGSAPPRTRTGGSSPRRPQESAPRSYSGASARSESAGSAASAGGTAGGGAGQSWFHEGGAGNAAGAGANPRSEPEFASLVPFGPPPIKKTPLEGVFEMLDKLESEGKTDIAAGAGALVLIIGASLPMVLIHSVAVNVFHVPKDFLLNGPGGLLNVAVWCATALIIIKNGAAGYQLFKVRQNPTIETVSHSTDALIQRIKAALAQAQVNGADWKLSQPETLDDGTIKVEAQLKFKAKAFFYFDADYDLSLQVRLLPSTTRQRSMVCYWFTPGADGMWLPPMADAVKTTDELLGTGIRI